MLHPTMVNANSSYGTLLASLAREDPHTSVAIRTILLFLKAVDITTLQVSVPQARAVAGVIAELDNWLGELLNEGHTSYEYVWQMV